MSHVITMLSNRGIVGAVGGEEARGTYAKLQSLSSVPWSWCKANAVVILLGFSIG